MFCNKCGKKTDNLDYICDECKQKEIQLEVSETSVEQVKTKEAPKEEKSLKNKIFSIISMVTGIISATAIFGELGICLGICAIVFGKIALKKNENIYNYIGYRCGIAGLITSFIFIIVYMIF